MEFEKQKMVGWFDTRQLARTGLQAVLSETFGNYADRRETQAALNPTNEMYDLSSVTGEFWLDYISDLGDGFDATFTVAKLLAQDQLMVEGYPIPRGDLLILGGDEVYPAPSMTEYNNRFKGPYKAAFPDKDATTPTFPEDIRTLSMTREGTNSKYLRRLPLMFAVPGNHDWYDGLTNFLKIFAQKRRIGNWQTVQDRSYFAIKLPHNCWIWGIDVQLDSDIDQPQRRYFEYIAKHKMNDGDRVILCTAEPVWVYHEMYRKATSYDRLNFFIRKYIQNESNWVGEDKSFRLLCVLTGDLHHYAHYETEAKENKEKVHYFTAGGGGTFLHPTHNLPNTLHMDTAPHDKRNNKIVKANLQHCYPPKDTSRGLLAALFYSFPFRSWNLIFTLGFFFYLMAYLMNIKIDDNEKDLIELAKSDGLTLWTWLGHLVSQLPFRPLLLVLLSLVGIGFYHFTDFKGTKKDIRWLGFLHGAGQLFLLLTLIFVFVKINFFYLHDVSKLFVYGLFIAEIVLVAGFMSVMLMATYLYVANRFFHIHLTESFSGMAFEQYKNILRIRLTETGIEVYPIGISEVTKNWENTAVEDDSPNFEGTLPSVCLIGAGPVRIDF
jgi:hypothetical protein